MTSTYRRGYRSRSYALAVGRVAKPNRRPGACRTCGEEVPAFGGQLYRELDGPWSVVHRPAEWSGSPVSGQWVGGCPDSTDRLNREGKFGGPDGAEPERERLIKVAAAGALMASRHEPARPGSYRLNSGAVVQGSRGRCEDAPCCGCCG